MSNISTIDILYFVFVCVVGGIGASLIAKVPEYAAKIKQMRQERIL
jgi:hypothetical protein